jgi:hypothetical protein
MSQKQIAKKDWVNLSIVLTILMVVAIGALVFGTSFSAGSTWIDHEGGDGPYTLPTGSRSEEEKAKQLEEDLTLDGPFVILKTTSEVEVIFSKANLGEPAEFNKSDIIPEVKY